MFFTVLLYTILLNFVHHYAYAKEECSAPKGYCSTPLVSASHWQSSIGQNATRIPFLETSSPSQQRSPVSQQDQSSHGILRRPMALQILHEDGESDSRHLRWMLGNVDNVQRSHLCAQATAKTSTPSTGSSLLSGLYRGLVRNPMEHIRQLMATDQQVPKEKNPIATSEECQQTGQIQKITMATTAPRTCKRQRSREGQTTRKRRSSGIWALATLHYMDFTASGTLPCRDIDSIYGDSHGNSNAAIWQAKSGEGGRRAVSTPSPAFTNPWTSWRTIRGDQEGARSHRCEHPQRRRKELQTVDLPLDTGPQEAFRHRRAVGLLPITMVGVPRQCYQDVDGPHRLLRRGGTEVLREATRSSTVLAVHQNTASRCTCENNVCGRHHTFRRAPGRTNSAGCHYDHHRCRGLHCRATACPVEDGPKRCCPESQGHHRGKDDQAITGSTHFRRRRRQGDRASRQEAAGFQLALTLQASAEASLTDCLATASWKGEGRTERRTKFRRLTFWPTVEAVSQ